MGQKVHPNGFRLGVIQDWSSIWYAGKDYADLLHEDLKLRDYIKKRLYHTGIAKINIERAGRKTKLHIYTARPGLVIGQRGAEVDKLRFELEKLVGHELLINIHEYRESADQRNGFNCGDKCEWNCNYLLFRFYPSRHQCQLERISPAGTSHRMPCATIFGKVLLK